MANNNGGLPNLSSTGNTQTQTGNSNNNNNSPTTAGNNAATNTGTNTNSPTQTNANALPSVSSDQTTASVAAPTSIITNAPSLSTDNGGFQLPTGLPTLSGFYSYPAPTVPPTANAPYMQSTQLPQNFVFIIVGACLAFVALIIILWHFLAAWSINRSFRRDAAAVAYTPLNDVKKKPIEPSHDMADLSSKLPKSFNSVPNLFFSPTAEVARQSMHRPASQHMPSGHYRDASR